MEIKSCYANEKKNVKPSFGVTICMLFFFFNFVQNRHENMKLDLGLNNASKTFTATSFGITMGVGGKT